MRMSAGRCLLATLMVGAVLTPGAGVAAASVPTCQGEPATIVGGPRQGDLEGTPGDDVIVSNGSSDVFAGLGDDLVCMTGQAPSEDGGQWVGVDAGPGDDSVTAALGEQDLLFVALGEGADQFAGGRESDYLYAGTFGADDEYELDDHEADVIDTGGYGLDYVVIGDGGPLADQVRVRSPHGIVHAYASGLTPEASLSGGARTALAVIDDAAGAWSVDLAEESASLAAVLAFSWNGFGRFVWAVRGTVTVQGTDGSDVVTGPVVGGDLGGGDDRVYAWASRTDHGSHLTPIDGGAGVDQLRVYAGEVDLAEQAGAGLVPFTPGDVTLDVRRQHVTFESGGVIPIAGFEWHGAQTNGVATLIGSAADDVLYGAACDLQVQAGGGDDLVMQVPRVGSAGFDNPTCAGRGGGRESRLAGGAGDDNLVATTRRATLLGGTGDDRLQADDGRDRLRGGVGDDLLLGEGGDDVLLGEAGIDTARGGRGDDTCRAEYGSDCERPRSATQLDPHPPGSRPSSVLLTDAAGDVIRHDDPSRGGGGTPLPDATTGDVVSVRTTYRHGRVTLRARLRSLESTDIVRLGFSIQYDERYQFGYADAVVVLRPSGRTHITMLGHDETCRGADAVVDREAALVEVVFDSRCVADGRWVRTALWASVTDDLAEPTYYDSDQAPEQPGGVGRYGPAAWRTGS